MRLRPWLRRTLWGSLALSVLLHFTGIFSEEIYAWLTRQEFEETELQKPDRQLKSMAIEEAPQDELAHVTPVETLQIRLQKPAPAKPAARQIARKEKTPPKARKPAAPQPGKPPAAVIASQPAPLPASEPASVPVVATTSVPASQPERTFAPGPAPVASAPVAPAVPKENFELARFPNELKITYVYGIVPATMNWKVQGGRYDLRLDVNFMGAARVFVSRGRVDRRGVMPELFQEFRNNRPEPHYQVDFNWNNMTAEFGELANRKTEPIARGDQDLFSVAFHIGLVGGANPEQTFSLFSGRRKYENARMSVAGQAKLRLGQKEVDAVLVRGQWDERKVDFWLAPEWNNIPVRMTMALGRDLSLDIWANEVTIEGRKVLEWVKPFQKRPGERGK